ncbi:MAG: sensor histidine kinase [Micromonosporaceae bacterium]|nr:sensor histidine kinase [Micromonosporaceae bacterium]
MDAPATGQGDVDTATAGRGEASRSGTGPELPWLLPAHLSDRRQPHASERRPHRSVRDWLVDLTAFLLSVGFALRYLPWRSGAPDLPEWLVVADVLAGGLGCAALWFRRRWPVGLAIALIPASAFSETAGLAIIIVLFTVAVHRRYQVALLLSGIHAALGLPYFALRPDDELPYWGTITLLWAFLAAVVAWGMFVRARRQLVLSLEDRARRAEAEQVLRVEQARHLERTRIAREMHDVLAHRISLLSMHAGALEFRPDAPAEEISRMAGVIRASAHQALQDLREVINVLRDTSAGDTPPPPQPTLADLPALVEESRQAGMRLQLHDRTPPGQQPPASIGRSAYRAAQEALTNARKHAPGTAVELTVAGGPGQGLTVEVVNRTPIGDTPYPQAAGTQAAPAVPGTGTGLIGLAERVQLCGGRIDHGRTSSGGFRVFAWLPWPA